MTRHQSTRQQRSADSDGTTSISTSISTSTSTSASTSASASDSDRLHRHCRQVLGYARDREYTGWDYADGLSSAFVQRLPIESKLVNLAVQETIKRAPVNLRPLFRVEQRRNYKGAALFAMANLDIYTLSGEPRYAAEARSLVDWLLEADNDWCEHFCGGGHRHPLQGLSSDRPSIPGEASGVVSTTYAVQALLQAAAVLDDPEYATVARSAGEFVLEELCYTERDDGACINYTVTKGEREQDVASPPHTLNANAIGARLLLELDARFGEPEYREAATSILDYVVSKQTAIGGWMYTDPPTGSHLSMDNFHNGFIIESLLRYRELTGSDRYDATIDRAMSFYRERLFDDDGAPNWDESSTYPRDSHAAAQGIIVFTEAGDLAFARRIIDWAFDALYAGDGQFYYQKRRFYTKRFTLMRWCQAWMAYAISTYLTAVDAE